MSESLDYGSNITIVNNVFKTEYGIFSEAASLVVKNNIIPPTINYETPDPECDIDCVPNVSRKQAVNIALNNGFAFGGNNACLVIKKFQN